jgi:hypothetical protein
MIVFVATFAAGRLPACGSDLKELDQFVWPHLQNK